MTETEKSVKVLLKGVVGSTAYGLNHAGSDIDYLGIFAAPTEQVLGLDWNKDRESLVTKDPDTSMHEVKKFISLCLNGNPSVSELLWLDGYEHMTEEGSELVWMRRAFLSERRVRASYLGYASGQFKRLKQRGDGSFSADTRKRTQKHARHLVRLVEQGYQLYRTGELVVNMKSSASEVDPEWVFGMGEMIEADPEKADAYMDRAGYRFDAAKSALPEKPDRDAVNAWLIRVRRGNWRV